MDRSEFVLAIASVLALAVGLSSGCAKKDARPARVPVSGSVLRAGEPVAGATVIFEPVGNTPAATGETDAQGSFRLTTFEANDGAAPGEYKVAVRKVQLLRGERPAQASDDQAAPPPDEKWLLPTKYGYTQSSGLKATVKPGETNDFKFELPD